MKKFNIHIRFMSLLFITVMSLSNWGCKNPKEGFELAISTDFLTGSYVFRIADAVTDNASAGLEGKIVTVSGPDAGVVFTEAGRKSFEIRNGMITVCLRKGITPTLTTPVNFFLTVNVPGFLPVVYPVSLIDKAAPITTIKVVDLDNLPQGSAKASVNANTDGNGITSKNLTDLPASASKTETASLTLDSLTILKDADGNALTGSVDGTIVHFSGSSKASYSSFPGGQIDNVIKDANGNVMAEQMIAPLGWLSISMKVGGVAVKSFNTPAKAVIEIPNNFYNPITNATYKAGDQISILSKDDLGTSWTKEATAVLTLNANNKLEASFDVTHLSTWTAAQMISQCVKEIPLGKNFTNVQIDIHFNMTAYANIPISSANAVKDYCEWINYQDFTGNKVYYKTGNSNYYVFEVIDVYAYDGENYDNSQVQVDNTPTLGCNIVMTPGTSTRLSTITGYFRAHCLSGAISYVVLPEGSVLYGIEEDEYNDPANQVNGAKPLPTARLNGEFIWHSMTLGKVTKADGSVFNSLKLAKNPPAGKFGITAGKRYKFAMAYDNKMYYYTYEAPTVLSDELSITMDVASCNQ